MKYLFFDIECANCDLGKGKICSFGYILTDESFNILEEDDILINPDAPFHLTGRKDKRDIKLGYPKEAFLQAERFPAFHERIFALITDKDTLAIGYAVINDVNFLISECERYSLSLPDFEYYDVQLLYSDYKSVRNVVSLERASTEFGVEITEEHVSREDARDTMLVAKGICDRLSIGLTDALKLSYRAKGNLKNGEKSSLAKTPKKREYISLKEGIYANNPTDSKNAKEERKIAFDIFGGEKSIPHNYDSGIAPSSTIGELLKGLELTLNENR